MSHEGESKNRLPDGHGTYYTYTYPNGATYVGEFKDGKFHGRGAYFDTDGSINAGEWKDGHQHGWGTRTSPLYTYVGEWEHGHKSGLGDEHAGGYRYSGEWKDGEKQGQGTMTDPDGSQYIGEWNDGMPNGQGIMTYANGDKYVGMFGSIGLRHGQGTLYGADGTIKRQGWWCEDEESDGPCPD